MGKSKDYKAGGVKKWLIGFGVLVLIAVVIIGIVIFIPANTYSMIGALQENEEHFFLQDTNKNKYEEFTSKIKDTSTISDGDENSGDISYYSDEIDDVKMISEGLHNILSFYNNYIVFAKNNKTLSSNTKSINNFISEANSIQENMNNIIDQTKILEVKSSSYLKNSWIDFRKEFNKYVENYYKMFLSLSECYKECFDVSFSQNSASQRILDAANDYVYCIMNDYKIVVNNDKKDNIIQGSYSYVSHTKVVLFKNFVDKCIVDNTEITKYIYDEPTQEKYNNLDKFFRVYKETDFKKLISSAKNDQILNTYTDVSDNNNLFEVAKNFLDRRS